MLTQLFLVESSYAQYCNFATSNLAITPTTTNQVSPIYKSGRRAFNFAATAGCTYYFETCGLATQDTYLRLYSTGTGGTVLATGDDNCGTQSAITWTCVTSGTYSILLTRYLCNNLSASNTQLRYRINSCAPPPPTCTDNEVTIDVTAGSFPSEVSWEFLNSAGAIVASGGAPYNQNLCLPTGCYDFVMNDSYGDGWNGAAYTVTYNGSTVGSGTLTGGTTGTDSGIGINTSCVVYGCMDPTALNYNAAATVDDGSCYYAVPSTGSNSFTTCSMTLYDNGGPSGNYANSSNGSTTIYPGVAGQAIELSFTTFNLENNYDFLYVYNGNSTAAPQVAGSPFTGTILQGNITSTATDGTLTLVFASDFSGTSPGFEFNVNCVPLVVSGCTDPTALNYNPAATSNDGSCIYAVAPPFCYDMNGSTGGFSNGLGGLAWNSGATSTPSSGTGPQGADASGGSGFYFTESTGIYSQTYDMTGFFDLSAGGYSMTFDYHMYGATMGNLQVLVNNNVEFSVTGDQGNAWFSSGIDLSAYTGTAVEISIRSTTGTSFTSDCAIDNICINVGPPVVPGCTDPLSINYNPSATVDDGFCYYAVPASGSNSFTSCSMTLYDNGGPSGNYANNSNGTTTIYPGLAGQYVQLSFASFDMESGWDYLYVYNGNSTAAAQVAGSPFTGTSLPSSITSSAADGSLTIQLTSDGTANRAGFEASVSCVSVLSGCMDPTAVNYNPAATVDDGSCVYPPANDDCINAQTVNIECTPTTAISGTTANATEQASIADPSCDPGTIQDVWYSFNSGLYTTVNLEVTLGSASWLGGEIQTTCGNPAPGLTIGGNAGNCDFNLSYPSPTVITGLTQNTDYLIRLYTNVDYDTPGSFTFTLSTDGLTVNAGVDQEVCEGASVTLSASGADSYSWDNGITDGVAFTATATTTYTVTGTAGSACPGTDAVVVTVNALPVVDAGTDETICSGNSAALSATATGGPNVTYSLTTSGGSYASEKWVNITTGVNGTGTVVWAQGNGTIGNSAGLLTNQSIDLTAYGGQTFYLNAYDRYADGWDGSVYALSYEGNVVINNGGISPNDGTNTDASSAWEGTAAELETSEAFTVANGLTLAWSPSATLSDAAIANPSATPTSTTTYTLTASYSGCSASDDVVISVDATPFAANAGEDKPACINNSATLSASNPPVGSGTWTWSPSAPTYVGGTSASDFNAEVEFSAAGQYTGTWTVTNGICTSTPDDAVVTVSSANNNVSLFASAGAATESIFAFEVCEE